MCGILYATWKFTLRCVATLRGHAWRALPVHPMRGVIFDTTHESLTKWLSSSDASHSLTRITHSLYRYRVVLCRSRFRKLNATMPLLFGIGLEVFRRLVGAGGVLAGG